MKVSILFVAIFTLALLIIPMLAVNLESTPVQVHTPTVPSTQNVAPPESSPPSQAAQELIEEEEVQNPEPEDEFQEEDFRADLVSAPVSQYGVDSFLILDESTGVVEEVSLQDFVRGAVAMEMPVFFHTEAIKAQAVAAHTFALNKHYLQQENPDPALRGADFAADPRNREVYITEAMAREIYGEDADLYWDKICEAVDSVLQYVMEYDDEPIVAAYHAMSSGRTESAGNVWSANAPYLVPVDSEGDYLAPDFESTATFTVEETQALLLDAYPEMDLSGDPESWFANFQWSPSGYVTAVEVGGVPLHGKDLRTLFGLRSHSMDIFWDDGGFTFTCYGYGHGVGMSQYGADFLARQGSTFDEILQTYYSGVEIKQIA